VLIELDLLYAVELRVSEEVKLLRSIGPLLEGSNNRSGRKSLVNVRADGINQCNTQFQNGQ